MRDAAAKRKKKRDVAAACPCAHECPMKAVACPDEGWEACGRDEAVKARASRLVRGRNGKLASKRSKTGDSACSAAMSRWVLSKHKDKAAQAILGKCRSKAHQLRKAADQRIAGREGRAQALEHRADRGLTEKQRMERATQLRSERAGKQAAPKPSTPARAAAARPSVREQAAKPKAATPKPKPAAATSSGPSAADRLRDIQRRATSMEPKDIDAAVDEVMRGVSAADVRKLNEDFLGVAIGGSKRKARDQYAKRIHDLRADLDRGRQILGMGR